MRKCEEERRAISLLTASQPKFAVYMYRHFLLALLIASTALLKAQENYPTNGAALVDHSLYVLQGATVHQDPTTTRIGADVWIQDGLIIKVTEGDPIPSYAITQDCKGKHIYASFIELYSEYGMPEIKAGKKDGPQIERSTLGTYGWNEAIRPENEAVRIFKHDKKAAEALRKHGYGAVLSQQQDGILRGTATVVSLGDERENNLVLKERAAAISSLSKGKSPQDYPSSRMGAIALLRQSYYDADHYIKGGSLLSKDLSLEALAVQRELPQIIVTKENNDILRADKIGTEFGFQYIFIGTGHEYERAQDVRSAGGLVVLPLDFPKPYDVSDPYMSQHIPLRDLRHWERAPSNAQQLIALGTDVAFTSHGLGEGSTVIGQARKSIALGLSSQDVIKALTTAPARALGMEGKLGVIRSGAIANLIVTDKDIWSDEGAILSNWVQGKEYVIQTDDGTDIAGVYELNIKGVRYPLTVSSSGDKDLGKLSLFNSADTSKVKVDIQEHDREINVQFTLPERGMYRLHGNINRRLNIWSGKGIGPSGIALDWTCVRKGDAPSSKQKDSEKLDQEMVSTLKYPNNGYGWTQKPTTENLILRNPTVWTNGPDGVLQDGDVMIADGKVIAVGHNLDLTTIYPKSKERPNFRTIDLYGKHITSGIIDEHSHIAITGGVNESGQASSAEVRIGDVIDPEDIDIYRQLAGGVTASQLLHGSANPIGGQSALVKLRWGANGEEMKIEGAAGFIKFALGENVKQSNWGDKTRERFPQTRMGVEQVYYDHFTRARAYQKLLNSSSTSETSKKDRKRKTLVRAPRKDLELEALVEILNSKRFITCHSYQQGEINMLMHVADSMGFRVNTFTHILEGYKVADKMKVHGVGGSTFSDWWAYKYEVREATPYNAALMSAQGITVAINSDDAEMGRRLNQEAAKGVKYGGMTEEDAWKMVTLNPANLLHLDRQMGSLEIGKDADIVVWSDHPLSIYAKAEQTYVDGIKYFDRADDAKLRVEIALERARIIEKMATAGKKGGTQPPKADKKLRWHCDDLGEYGKEQGHEH